MWARSFLLRYEPSGAVGFAYRVSARERIGASTPQVLVATAYEQLAVVVAGALVAITGWTVAGLRPPLLAWALALAAVLVAAVAMRPAVLGRWATARMAARGVDAAVLRPGRLLVGMAGVDAIGWLATGLGAWVLVHALGARLDAGLLLGAHALSWLLGVLVPLAPGGLGLRDGSLALALGTQLAIGTATALALALRLVSFAGELAAVALLELVALVLARTSRARDAATSRLPVAREGAVAAATEGAAGALRVAGPPRGPTATEPAVGVARDGAVATTHNAEPPRGRTLVVVPTYDEADALPLFVARFAPTGLELLIVDDGSPDGTGALADGLAAERPWMHVLHRTSKDGLGMAYRAGFAWALDRGYEVVGQMDCALSHPPETLAELLTVLHARDADLVIASRYLPGGGTQG